MSSELYSPINALECAEYCQQILSDNGTLQVVGAGTRSKLSDNDCISTLNLNGIRFFHPEDMVVGVESGVTFNQLSAILADRGMVLPVNAWHSKATIGGMVAANDYGPDRLFNGGLRDYLIGAEYVDGRGRLVKAGGRVVKNVTGYDAARMMIGSRGGLGCLTALNFRVVPAKQLPMVGFVKSDCLAPMEKLHGMAERREPLDWVQVRGNKGAWQFAFGFSGNVKRVAELGARLSGYLRRDWRITSENELDPEWVWARADSRNLGFLQAIPSVFPDQPWHLHLVAPTSVWKDHQRLEAAVGENGYGVFHPIGGDVHLFFPGESDVDRPLASCLRAWREKATIECVRTPETITRTWGHFVSLPDEHRIACRLKNHLDPQSLFYSAFYQQPRQESGP